MTTLEWHGEMFEKPHLAVNVKVRSPFYKSSSLAPYFIKLGWDKDEFETLVENTFEQVAQDFWEYTVQEIGKKYGFDEVFSEGRMGGWAAPTVKRDFITEEMLTPDIAEKYTKFRNEVKKVVDSVDESVYNQLKCLWKSCESDFLKEHSLTTRILSGSMTNGI